MAYESILVDVDDHICTITLNRPDALNALNAQIMTEVCDALEEADASEKVRCIIITGSDKAFAAGADVTEMADATYADMMNANAFTRSAKRIHAIRKPIIAAVSGYALGGGCELAMMCDMIIASDTARFGLPEVNLGIIPGIGGTQRLPRNVGKSKAMDMVLTGRFMDAEEAEQSGLVCRVVPAKKLRSESREIAHKITEKSMLAVIAAKSAVKQAFNMPLDSGLVFEQQLFAASFSTEDQKEGMAAFIEKREAQFRDK